MTGLRASVSWQDQGGQELDSLLHQSPEGAITGFDAAEPLVFEQDDSGQPCELRLDFNSSSQETSKVVVVGTARNCEVYCRNVLEREPSYIGTVRGVPGTGQLSPRYTIEVPFQATADTECLLLRLVSMHRKGQFLLYSLALHSAPDAQSGSPSSDSLGGTRGDSAGQSQNATALVSQRDEVRSLLESVAQQGVSGLGAAAESSGEGAEAGGGARAKIMGSLAAAVLRQQAQLRQEVQSQRAAAAEASGDAGNRLQTGGSASTGPRDETPSMGTGLAGLNGLAGAMASFSRMESRLVRLEAQSDRLEAMLGRALQGLERLEERLTPLAVQLDTLHMSPSAAQDSPTSRQPALPPYSSPPAPRRAPAVGVHIPQVRATASTELLAYRQQQADAHSADVQQATALWTDGFPIDENLAPQWDLAMARSASPARPSLHRRSSAPEGSIPGLARGITGGGGALPGPSRGPRTPRESSNSSGASSDPAASAERRQLVSPNSSLLRVPASLRSRMQQPQQQPASGPQTHMPRLARRTADLSPPDSPRLPGPRGSPRLLPGGPLLLPEPPAASSPGDADRSPQRAQQLQSLQRVRSVNGATSPDLAGGSADAGRPPQLTAHAWAEAQSAVAAIMRARSAGSQGSPDGMRPQVQSLNAAAEPPHGEPAAATPEGPQDMAARARLSPAMGRESLTEDMLARVQNAVQVHSQQVARRSAESSPDRGVSAMGDASSGPGSDTSVGSGRRRPAGGQTLAEALRALLTPEALQRAEGAVNAYAARRMQHLGDDK